MDMTQTYNPRLSGLPDPDYHAEFYTDVPFKRLMAWGIDILLITLLVGIATLLGALLPLFFLPFLYFCIGFLYRWFTIASGSATLGMRVMAIELLNGDGSRLDSRQAFLHTLGYAVSVVTVPLQLISIIMMAATPRGQGLTDTVLGTTAVNRRFR
jgi:uncharacterized RDD family membrane protein YckC